MAVEQPPRFVTLDLELPSAEPVVYKLRTSTRSLTSGGDLGQVVPEPIFDISRLVEAARHQRLDPLLGRGPPERRDARIPPGAELETMVSRILS